MIKFNNKLLKFLIVFIMNICFTYSTIAVGFDDVVDEQWANPAQNLNPNNAVNYVNNVDQDQNIELHHARRSNHTGWNKSFNEFARWLKYLTIGIIWTYLFDLIDAQSVTTAPAPAPPVTVNTGFNASELTFYIQIATLGITLITLLFGAGKFCIEHVDRDWNAETGYNISAFIRNCCCGTCCMCCPNRMLQQYRLPRHMPEPDLELGELHNEADQNAAHANNNAGQNPDILAANN